MLDLGAERTATVRPMAPHGAVRDRGNGPRTRRRPDWRGLPVARFRATRSLGMASATAAIVAVCGCSEPEADNNTRTLELHVVPSCRPADGIDQVRVAALGDFPTSDDTVEILVPDAAPIVIDRFPLDTRALTVSASGPAGFRGAGVQLVYGPSARSKVLLIPFGESCPLADPDAVALRGSTPLALPNGGLLLIGGLTSDGDLASRRVLELEAGELLTQQIGNGLQNRRHGASGTVVGLRVLIAGGAAGGRGPADDTYELLDPETGETTLGRLCDAASEACIGRLDHGAIALSPTRVLLAGGAGSIEGTALDSAMIIDVEHGRVETAGSLPAPRRSPQMHMLDDGTILAVGGLDESNDPSGSVYYFDRESNAFAEALDDGGHALPPLPSERSGVAVPLVGARLLWVGGDEAADGSRQGTLLMRQPPYHLGAPSFLRLALPDLLPEALRDIRALGLDDGAVLIGGINAVDDAVAYRVDIGRDMAAPTALARPIDAVVRLVDGSIVELGAQGMSLRRETLITQHDSPPNTLLAGSLDGLAADTADHWFRDGAGFAATTAQARIDVPTLRFGAFRAVLDADGDVELLLVIDGAPPIAVALTPNDAGPGLCTVRRDPGSKLTIERSGTSIAVTAGTETRKCRLDLPQRVGIAMRAREAGSVLRSLSIARLSR